VEKADVIEALCIDTSVMMKYLCPDEQTPQAIALITEALTQQTRLVAPCFAWAEVGSVEQSRRTVSTTSIDIPVSCKRTKNSNQATSSAEYRRCPLDARRIGAKSPTFS
jgi:predicted nucleic acid-binding protein